MITFINPDILKYCINEFNNYSGLNLQLSIKNNGKLLPSVRSGNITYNPHLNTFLLLQNLTFKYPFKAQRLPFLFYLSYTLIDYNYYDDACLALHKLKHEIGAIIKFIKTQKGFHNNFFWLDCQYLVALYHELAHVFFKLKPEYKTQYHAISKQALNRVVSYNSFTKLKFKSLAKELQNDQHWLEELSCDIWGINMIRQFLNICNYKPEYIQEILTRCVFIDYTMFALSLNSIRVKGGAYFNDYLRVLSLSENGCALFMDKRLLTNYQLNTVFFSIYPLLSSFNEKRYSRYYKLIDKGATVPVFEKKEELMSELSDIENYLCQSLDDLQIKASEAVLPNPFIEGSKQYEYFKALNNHV